jgi:hypothetical protein
MTLHFAQLSGTLIRIQSISRWMIQRQRVPRESISGIGMFPWEIDPTIYNPYLVS